MLLLLWIERLIKVEESDQMAKYQDYFALLPVSPTFEQLPIHFFRFFSASFLRFKTKTN